MMIKDSVCRIKYIYLDVENFTVGRTIEDQTDIIKILNTIVRESVIQKLPNREVTYIPVGDGICIAFEDDGKDYDCHIRISLEILRRIWVHNRNSKSSRQFKVRIGINENVDNVIVDINERKNFSGTGINDAQRIMSCADGGQIIVGLTVYDILRQREKYAGQFRRYEAQIKHGSYLAIYQFIGGNIAELNRNIPSRFESKAAAENKLTKFAAYYFAHCIKNRKLTLALRKPGIENYALGLLLWYLATDSKGRSESTLVYAYDDQVLKTATGDFKEQFEEYCNLPGDICIPFSMLALKHALEPYFNCFADGWQCLIINSTGINKLNSEWPEIWKEFNLGELLSVLALLNNEK